MQDLTIALVQSAQHWEDKEANLADFEKKLAPIDAGVDLILLPEMFHTSFTMNASDLAEKMDGAGINWLKKQAAISQSALATSLIIEENEKYYNRMVFVTPEGTVSTYDKQKLFGMAKEDQHYDAGSKNTIVHFKGWKIMLQVCYDLRFPELSRNKLDSEGQSLYDVLLYVANWPEKRNAHWNTLLKARAIENQCFVAAVNRVGADANSLSYSGDSAIINPLGEVLATEQHTDCIISSTISAKMLNETRAKLPFLKDA